MCVLEGSGCWAYRLMSALFFAGDIATARQDDGVRSMAAFALGETGISGGWRCPVGRIAKSNNRR